MGDENTTRPKIENILIRAAIKRIKPPNIAKYLERFYLKYDQNYYLALFLKLLIFL